MAFELPALPYADDALEPFYTANTISYHHKKHHNNYVVTLNGLIKDTELEGKTLVEIIKASVGSKPAVFNNSAQVYNHTMFWHSMAPNAGGVPKGAIADKIAADFGSYDEFAKEFKAAGASQFGSGWAWLVVGVDGKLKVVKTPNAENPLTNGDKPLLCCDVWEHAYYLDYQNLRAKFLEVFLDKLVNWDFANEMLAGKEFTGDK